jgi:hypothetical protein
MSAQPAGALWASQDESQWRRALDTYPSVLDQQGVQKLPALDAWVRDELPATLASRRLAHITRDELVRVTEWKMHRGVWRAPNVVRVKSNDAELVMQTTVRAFALCPHPTKPVGEIATLDGVGPATASSVLAAFLPAVYPFFDELVAAQVPGLGAVKWTLGYYGTYAARLRERAAALGIGWTAAMVERAVWASVGGKASAAIA